MKSLEEDIPKEIYLSTSFLTHNTGATFSSDSLHPLLQLHLLLLLLCVFYFADLIVISKNTSIAQSTCPWLVFLLQKAEEACHRFLQNFVWQYGYKIFLLAKFSLLPKSSNSNLSNERAERLISIIQVASYFDSVL